MVIGVTEKWEKLVIRVTDFLVKMVIGITFLLKKLVIPITFCIFVGNNNHKGERWKRYSTNTEH